MYVCKDIALCRFLHIEAISRQKEARSRDYTLPLFRMTSGPTLHAFEQFGAMYMHNHDDTFPVRLEFEPGTSRLQASVDKNEYFFLNYIILNSGNLKFRELGNLKFWELGNLKSRELRNLRFRELRILRTSELTLGCPTRNPFLAHPAECLSLCKLQ